MEEPEVDFEGQIIVQSLPYMYNLFGISSPLSA